MKSSVFRALVSTPALVVALAGTLTLTAACGAPAPEGAEGEQLAGEESSLDYSAIAGVLVERMGLQPGERVLLVGVPGRFDPLVPLLRSGIESAGAEYLGAWAEEGNAPAAWTTW